MGGMGDFISGGGFQGALRGLSSGMQTGSSIANAEYNANAMRMQANALEQQSDISAYLIRKEYESEYNKLMEDQTRQQSWNRVLAAKRGITGASADATMQSYAMKAQKNLETLYYNAAMKTGQQSLQYSDKIQALNAKAAQYDWQAKSALVGGVISMGTNMLQTAAHEMKGTTQVDPTAGLTPGSSDKSGYSDLSIGLSINRSLYG